MNSYNWIIGFTSRRDGILVQFSTGIDPEDCLNAFLVALCKLCMLRQISLFALETDLHRWANFQPKKLSVECSHNSIVRHMSCLGGPTLSFCGCLVFLWLLYPLFSQREESAIVDCMLATARATSCYCTFSCIHYDGRSDITNTFTCDSIRFVSIRLDFLGDSRKRLPYEENI